MIDEIRKIDPKAPVFFARQGYYVDLTTSDPADPAAKYRRYWCEVQCMCDECRAQRSADAS